METKVKEIKQSPLSCIPTDTQRIIVQYLGVAHSALIPFLPQSYFTQWDIVICLWNAMKDGVNAFEDCVNTFGKIWVMAVEGGSFMIRSNEKIGGHVRVRLTSLGDCAESCIILLSTYVDVDVLELIMRRRNDKSGMHIAVTHKVDEGDLKSPDWRTKVRDIYSSTHLPNRRHLSADLVDNVFLRNPEDIEKEHYLEYVDTIALLSGEYRPYYEIYNLGSKTGLEIAKGIPEVPITSILREMGVTLTEEEVVRSGNKYLIDHKRASTDLSYLVHLFSLPFIGDRERGESQRARDCPKIYSAYPHKHSRESEYGEFLHRYFSHHVHVRTPVTEEQRRVMKSILPLSLLTHQNNVDLCLFFRTDLDQHILSFLRKIDNEDIYYGNDRIISTFITTLRDRQMRKTKERRERKDNVEKDVKAETDAKKKKKHETKEKFVPLYCIRYPIGGRYTETDITQKEKWDEGAVYGVGEEGMEQWRWREVSPCERFVSSLLELCIHPKVAKLLHGCEPFVEYVNTEYKSHADLSRRNAREEVTRIMENKLCVCHWDGRKEFDTRACRTPLFITAEFGCALTRPEFIRRIDPYRRDGEHLDSMLIDLQCSHMFDVMYGKTFEHESGFEHRNIISLFPKRDAPYCTHRNIHLEEPDFGLYRVETVNIRTMSYGKTLDKGMFKDYPHLQGIIRRAAKNAEKYRNVTRDVATVLRKMVPSAEPYDYWVEKEY